MNSGNISGVCASVRIEIDQTLAITRSAFVGTLSIANGMTDGSLTSIKLDLDIRDENNNPSNNLFGISSPILAGLTAVDGTGVILASTTGSAQFTFVPTEAAAAFGASEYHIGGMLSYVDGGVAVKVPLMPSIITVEPQASLKLNYFLQRDVIGDDPFTPAVEPSEPFVLGLVAQNVGLGTADDVSITSSQPKIIENAKGLLVDFKMIGTTVGTQSVTPSLTVNLGNIEPGQTQTAEFVMTSSLQGIFKDYTATFTHKNAIGSVDTSLLKSVAIHSLVHAVQVTPGGKPDFLAADTPTPTGLPDTLYNSDGTVFPVTLATSAQTDAPVGGNQLTDHVTGTVQSGYFYLSVVDPSGGNLKLSSVVRSDGKVIPVGSDAWTTDRTFFPDGSFNRDHNLHIFDKAASAGTVSYTLVFTKFDTTAPTISSLQQVSPNPTNAAVSTLDVTFGKPINPSTFDYHAVNLSFNGGPNLITNTVTITPVAGQTNTYRINGLSGLTSTPGSYTLTVDATGVQDLSANNGVGSANDTWTVVTGVPIVQNFSVSPNPRNTSVQTEDVSFSMPIDPTTFDFHALTLSRNGGPNLITNAVTVVPLTSADTTFRIGGLASLTTADGTYVLSVDATKVKDQSDVKAGVGSNSTQWVMDTVAPTVVSIEQLNDPVRSIVVQTLDVTLSKAIDPTTFDWHAVTLTRNAGPNLITDSSTVTVSRLTPTTYRLSNFSFVSGQDGVYVITINGSALKDPAGNVGTGSVSETWTMITVPPAPPTNVHFTPVSTFVAGLTNTGNITVTGNLPATGLRIRLTDMTTGAEYGEATINGQSFTESLNILVSGPHHIRVRESDAAANVTDSYLDVFIDTTPPVITSMDSITSPRATPLSTEGVTISKAIDPSTFDWTDITLTKDGSTTNLITSSGVTVTPDSTADKNFHIGGLTSLTTTPGVYTLTVHADAIKDQAGNLGSGFYYVTWTVQSSAPAAPTGLAITPDTGPSPNDGLTNTSAVTLTGSLGATGLSVDVFDATANADLGTATVTGTSFSKLLNLAQGTHKLNVTAIDSSNNPSPVASYTVTVDLTTPPAPTNLAITPNTGVTPGLTNANAVTLTGSLAIAARNVDVFDLTKSVDLGFATISNNTFSLALNLSAGSHQLQVTDTSAVGTASAPALFTVVVDQTAPTATLGSVASPRNTLVSTDQFTFSKPINPLSLTTPGLFSLTLNGGVISTSSLATSLLSGNTYSLSGLGGLTSAQGTYVLTLNMANVADLAGNAGTGSPSVTWILDTTPPKSQVSSLAASQTSYSFLVTITGSDPAPSPGVASAGLASYDIYVAVNGGAFPALPTMNVPANAGPSTTFTFTGVGSTSYAFRSVARDLAGNVESKPITVEASTYVPDLTAPVTLVNSAVPNSSTATIVLTASGTDSGGSGLASITFWVSVDNAAAVQIVTLPATTPTVTTTYQGDANSTHTYRFYSTGTDNAHNVESAHVAPNDITLSNVVFPPQPLVVTGLSVQHGQVERSYVRYVDLAFNQSGAALQSLIAGNKISLVQHSLDNTTVIHTWDAVALQNAAKLTALDHAIELDFGVLGLGGVARGNQSLNAYWNALIGGDGYYELDIDLGGGNTKAEFFDRLLGDVTGDGVVDSTDLNNISGAIGLAGNLYDVNGDGSVDIVDKQLATKSNGRKLKAGLHLDA